MSYDHILIRFGEMSTKGKNRYKFVSQLKRNIQTVLSEYPKVKYEPTRDRLFLRLNGEDHDGITEKLRHVFGIQSFSLAIKCDSELESIQRGALGAMMDLPYKGKTFKVSTKRADKSFPLDTNELNHAIGGHILRSLDQEITVDVRNPDINLRIEVRSEATYITAKDIVGSGGLPVGTSGKGMLMLSGGIDSPVAGYLAMKRGLSLEMVHFFSPPYTSDRAKQKVLDLTQTLTKFTGEIVVHIVPFTEIQQTIAAQVPENYTTISTRRMMLQITELLRKKRNSLAIVSGDSLGQVASQTLESMFAINEVTSTPILRPVVAMDKNEIIALAKQIDTYEISTRPFEDCCTVFMPTAPKTRPKTDKVSFYESFVDFQVLMEKAVEHTETLTIRPGMASYDLNLDGCSLL